MVIDDPAVKAEVEAAFATYETALTTNDVPTLEALFRDDPLTVRYGILGSEAMLQWCEEARQAMAPS